MKKMKGKIMPFLTVILIGVLIWHSTQIQRQNQELVSKLVRNLEKEDGSKDAEAENIFLDKEEVESSNFLSEKTPEVLASSDINKYLNPTCLDDYQSLPHSTKFKASKWSTHFAKANYQNGKNNSYSSFIDINGDGLLDYVSFYHDREHNPWCGNTPSTVSNGQDIYYNCSTSIYNRTEDCIYLNNGNGWDPVYRCTTVEVHRENSYYNDNKGRRNLLYDIYFYGDCADTSGT